MQLQEGETEASMEEDSELAREFLKAHGPTALPITEVKKAERRLRRAILEEKREWDEVRKNGGGQVWSDLMRENSVRKIKVCFCLLLFSVASELAKRCEGL